MDPDEDYEAIDDDELSVNGDFGSGGTQVEDISSQGTLPSSSYLNVSSDGTRSFAISPEVAESFQNNAEQLVPPLPESEEGIDNSFHANESGSTRLSLAENPPTLNTSAAQSQPLPQDRPSFVQTQPHGNTFRRLNGGISASAPSGRDSKAKAPRPQSRWTPAQYVRRFEQISIGLELRALDEDFAPVRTPSPRVIVHHLTDIDYYEALERAGRRSGRYDPPFENPASKVNVTLGKRQRSPSPVSTLASPSPSPPPIPKRRAVPTPLDRPVPDPAPQFRRPVRIPSPSPPPVLFQHHYAQRNAGDTYALNAFFARYPPFRYNPSVPASNEFHRMCRTFDWAKDNPAQKEAWKGFREAMVQQFNQIYGMDENNITNWQFLCQVLRISPIPDSLYACREAVLNTHVNLMDLLDRHGTGKEVKVFETLEGLRSYTKATRRFFPRERAKAGGILKYLLRKIFGV
ncbi:hypothetical protein K474DRAFT_1669145 [Panus rudis PR-1116 ss-1]|nr:hypothetical protein K474DRAFT_1669145 [Panus rudis PR-1116 ss-1]